MARDDMKTQTSLEFLLIASVLALLSLSALYLYGKDIAVNKMVLSKINYSNGVPSAGNTSMIPDPQVRIYVPLSSSTTSSNYLQAVLYGCANGTARLSFSSPTASFSYNSTSTQISNMTLLSDQFLPAPGLNVIDANYSMLCGTQRAASSVSFNTYASSGGGYGTNGGEYAYLSTSNESVAYPIASQAPVYTISQSSHCTITNYWSGGSTWPPAAQCGNPSTWDYIVSWVTCGVSPYYSYSRSFCMFPDETAYNISTTMSNYSISYRLGLEIYTPSGILTSNLSGLGATSRLYLNGLAVGNATISGASAGIPPNYAELISYRGSYSEANQTDYNAYTQAKNSLYPTLAYYNGSSVSGDIQSAIQEGIVAFNSSAQALVASASSAPQQGCSITNKTYTCKSTYPISFIINASISQPSGIENATLYYQGSVINLKVRR